MLQKAALQETAVLQKAAQHHSTKNCLPPQQLAAEELQVLAQARNVPSLSAAGHSRSARREHLECEVVLE